MFSLYFLLPIAHEVIYNICAKDTEKDTGHPSFDRMRVYTPLEGDLHSPVIDELTL